MRNKRDLANVYCWLHMKGFSFPVFPCNSQYLKNWSIWFSDFKTMRAILPLNVLTFEETRMRILLHMVLQGRHTLLKKSQRVQPANLDFLPVNRSYTRALKTGGKEQISDIHWILNSSYLVKRSPTNLSEQQNGCQKTPFISSNQPCGWPLWRDATQLPCNVQWTWKVLADCKSIVTMVSNKSSFRHRENKNAWNKVNSLAKFRGSFSWYG